MAVKKRNKAYKPRGTSIPMIINRKLEENVESLEEMTMILAFRTGYATKEHYDYLVRISNTLNIMCQAKPTDSAIVLKDKSLELVKVIFDRYQRTGKFGVSAIELRQMINLVEGYDTYMKMLTTTFYNECIAELNAFYAELEHNKVAA